MSDIPDQYGNSALISLLSVFHENRVKTSLSLWFNKTISGYYAMNMLCCKPVLGDNVLHVKDFKKHD